MSLVVVGDCLRDVDIDGTTDRVCPDAPVPVVDVRRETSRAGGAGLAAILANSAGVPVTLVTAVADDADGVLLRADLADVPVVACRSRASTPVKARLRSEGQTLARMDRGGRGPDPEPTDEMLDVIHSADAVLVSDYGRGLVRDPRLRSALADAARRVPVVWDPHPRGPEPVPGVTAVTPNASEARVFSALSGEADAARLLRARWDAESVVVTCGDRGALLHTAHGTRMIPTHPVGTADPCGAGDRFATAMAAALMAGTDLGDAVSEAIAETAHFLSGGGVSAARSDSRRDGSDTAHAVVSAVRAAGGRVVATGGCFDLMHAGHARTLAAARAMGDCLVVCLNSDASVRRLKGPSRPIVGEHDRAELLLALGCVDAVAVFGEDDPRRLLAELRPDVWVKGGDYDPDDLAEAELVRGWGGEVVVTPYVDGRSTTRLAGALAAVS